MNSRRRVSLLQAARLRLRSVLALVGALTLFLVLFFSVRAWYASGRHHAVPPELAIEAHLAAFPEEVRYFARDSGDIELLEKEFIDSWDREKAFLHREELPPTSYLAISGGGDRGAFGAGFLNGWTQAGTRPQFKLVTGVSTGALIAPFAFLGPEYDKTLKAIFTSVSQKDIEVRRFFASALLDDALADTTPLAQLLKLHVNQALIDAIAAEYAKGRLLFIGTTDLDARRPVIWNVTKIAASGRPESIELLRKVMLASAAIPGEFPPVMLDVVANGKNYQEMHVDGGATTQIFLDWGAFPMQEVAVAQHASRERKVYALVNFRLDPDWGEVERRTLPITFQAISTLIQYQVIMDLYRVYTTTQSDGIDFNLAYIPATFQAPHTAEFEPTFMRKLYEVGFKVAAAGYPWTKHPPLQIDSDHKQLTGQFSPVGAHPPK